MSPRATSERSGSERVTLGRRIAAFLVDSMVTSVPLAVILTATPVGEDAAVALAVANTAYAVYFIAAWSLVGHGQTLGMRLLGIRVDTPYGELSLGAAMTRYAVFLLGSICFGLGLLWAIVDRQGRAWHDIAAGSRVVATT